MEFERNIGVGAVPRLVASHRPGDIYEIVMDLKCPGALFRLSCPNTTLDGWLQRPSCLSSRKSDDARWLPRLERPYRQRPHCDVRYNNDNVASHPDYFYIVRRMIRENYQEGEYITGLHVPVGTPTRLVEQHLVHVFGPGSALVIPDSILQPQALPRAA